VEKRGDRHTVREMAPFLNLGAGSASTVDAMRTDRSYSMSIVTLLSIWYSTVNVETEHSS